MYHSLTSKFTMLLIMYEVQILRRHLH